MTKHYNYRCCCQCSEAPTLGADEEYLCDDCREIFEMWYEQHRDEFYKRCYINRFYTRGGVEHAAQELFQVFLLSLIRKRGLTQVLPTNEQFVLHVQKVIHERLAPEMSIENSSAVTDLIRNLIREEINKVLHKFASFAQQDDYKKHNREKNKPIQSLDRPMGGHPADDAAISVIDQLAEENDSDLTDEEIAQFRSSFNGLRPRERLVWELSNGVCMGNWTAKEIGDAIGELTQRERLILQLITGQRAKKKWKYAQIGNVLHISFHMVKKIKILAMDAIGRPQKPKKRMA